MNTASAQQQQIESSSAEVGLIFHKMMDSPPDFDLWSTIYMPTEMKENMGPEGQLRHRQKLKEMYQRAYNNLVPEEEVLYMNFPAKIEVVPVDSSNVDGSHNVHMFFDSTLPFFVSDIPEHKLALVVNDLDALLNHVISHDDFLTLSRQAKFKDIYATNDVIVSFTLLPEKVNKGGPIEIEKQFYWGFYANAIRIEIRDPKEGRKIWQYVHMPEYDMKQKTLRSLHQRSFGAPVMPNGTEGAGDIPKLF